MQAADEFASDGLNDDTPGIFYKGNPRPPFDPESPAQASGNNQLSLGRDHARFDLHSAPTPNKIPLSGSM